jgi:hypothetical protein
MALSSEALRNLPVTDWDEADEEEERTRVVTAAGLLNGNTQCLAYWEQFFSRPKITNEVNSTYARIAKDEVVASRAKTYEDPEPHDTMCEDGIVRQFHYIISDPTVLDVIEAMTPEEKSALRSRISK